MTDLPQRDLRVEWRPVAALIPYGRNARKHSDEDVAALAGSIRTFGWTAPLLVDGDNGLIAGHKRLLAARQLGLAQVPVIELAGLSETEKRAYIIADNQHTLRATWDQELLSLEVMDLHAEDFDLSTLGFDKIDLDKVLAPEPTADLTDADAAPEPPRDPVTRPGDLWRLGEHRLLCGDSTDAAAVDRLMAGERAALLFTSPPYGHQRDYATGGVGDWEALMRGVFGHLAEAMGEDGQVLVNLGLVHRDNEWQPYWEAWLDWMRGRGWRRFGLYVWDQGPGLPGDWSGRLAPAFELVFHFNRVARKPNKIVPCKRAGHVTDGHGGMRRKDGTVGDWSHAGQGIQETRIPDGVIRVTRHMARGIETEHPAVFPVALPEFVMNAYTREGDLVYEPFAGSGTTLLAGERAGRRVRALELAPAYVDVALRRWRRLFPAVPVALDGDGRGLAEVATERGVALDDAA